MARNLRATILTGVVAAGLLGLAGCQVKLGDMGEAPLLVPGAPLPPDVNPESLNRMAPVPYEDLDELGKEVYEKLGGAGSYAVVRGPGGLSLHSPGVAEGMNVLNSYLRGGHTALTAAQTQLAILVASREMDQAYEWSGHEPDAREAGVDEEVINIVKNDLDLVGISKEEANIIRMGRQLFRNHNLTSDVWANTVEYFGDQGAFELTAVMGDYAMAAIMLHAVNQQIPPERTATLPARPGTVIPQ